MITHDAHFLVHVMHKYYWFAGLYSILRTCWYSSSRTCSNCNDTKRHVLCFHAVHAAVIGADKGFPQGTKTIKTFGSPIGARSRPQERGPIWRNYSMPQRIEFVILLKWMCSHSPVRLRNGTVSSCVPGQAPFSTFVGYNSRWNFTKKALKILSML